MSLADIGSFTEFTGFYRVKLDLTGFYRVLPSFTEFYRVLPSFTEFTELLALYRWLILVVKPSFTEF